MPKSSITWYKTKANKIMKDIRQIPQKKICTEINEKQTTISYRIRKVYQKQLEDMIRILKMAGYEIVEKEGQE